MNGFRTLLAAILIPLPAIVTTVVGIEQLQAGGEGTSNGIRALIAAAVFWLLAVMAVKRFFKVAGEVAETLAADANPSVGSSPEDDPPRRIM